MSHWVAGFPLLQATSNRLSIFTASSDVGLPNKSTGPEYVGEGVGDSDGVGDGKTDGVGDGFGLALDWLAVPI